MAEKEYIEREALIKACKKIIHDRWNETTAPVSWSHAYADFIDDIKEQPTADVAPVRHGHIIWKRRRRGGFRHAKCLHRFCNFVIEDNAPCKHIAKIDERYTTDEPYCSECGKLLGDFLNYCGNCGAKMDGDKNDP